MRYQRAMTQTFRFEHTLAALEMGAPALRRWLALGLIGGIFAMEVFRWGYRFHRDAPGHPRESLTSVRCMTIGTYSRRRPIRPGQGSANVISAAPTPIQPSFPLRLAAYCHCMSVKAPAMNPTPTAKTN